MDALREVSRGRSMTGPGAVAEKVLDHYAGAYAEEAWENFNHLRRHSTEEWAALNLRVDQGMLDEIAAAADEIKLERKMIVPAILLSCQDRFDELAVTRPKTRSGAE